MGDANAKRVDLDTLRRVREYLCDVPSLAAEVRDAIAEIEAARAAPAPSAVSDRSRCADAVAALPGACMTLASYILDRVERAREAGPSRAARLVAYRCAALAVEMHHAVEWNAGNRRLRADGAEDWARAMLAAEREPQS